MEEIFTLADRVTVLRNGQLVTTVPVAQTDTLSLVALMLGRDPEQVRASGLTAFSETGTGQRQRDRAGGRAPHASATCPTT